MTILIRRSVLRSPLAFGAAGASARTYIANAAAATPEAWFAQGFAKRKMPLRKISDPARFERLS